MAYHNRTQHIGNVTAKPELRKTASDKSVVNFSLALNNPYGDDKEPLFLDFTAWNRTAEILAEYVDKGDPLFVEGRLEMEHWEDKQTGQPRSKCVIVADTVQLLGAKKKTPAEEPAKKPRTAKK